MLQCPGARLSLKTQDLTAIFLAIRLYCSFMMEYDIHTLLDLLTLAATIWVIYTMRTTLKARWRSTRSRVHFFPHETFFISFMHPWLHA